MLTVLALHIKNSLSCFDSSLLLFFFAFMSAQFLPSGPRIFLGHQVKEKGWVSKDSNVIIGSSSSTGMSQTKVNKRAKRVIQSSST